MPLLPQLSPIAERLKQKYEQANELERFDGTKYPISQSYINLVIVKQQKETEKKEGEPGKDKDSDKKSDFRDERLQTYEALYNIQESIDKDKIFEAQDGKPAKKVVMFGRAGIGKSTFCKYLAVQWQEGKLWDNQFKAIVWLPLRELLSYGPNPGISLEQVIIDRCMIGRGKPSIEQVKAYLDADMNKLLFILDGYDEVVQVIDQYPWMQQMLQDILTTPEYHVILTSRPAFISKIGSQDIKFDKQLENIGFTNENIKAYVEIFYKEHAEELLKFLESNKSIWGVAHIPINLDLICNVWQPGKQAQETSTMSQLYGQITEKLMRRYLKKEGESIEGILPSVVKEKTGVLVQALEKLALFGMQENQIILSGQRVQQEVLDKIKEQSGVQDLFSLVLKSGVIRASGENRSAQDLNFLHLTFQEYYAASGLARGFSQLAGPEYEAAVRMLQDHKYNKYYEVVWWFTSGILYEQGRKKDNDFLPLLKFWDAFERHPRELIGVRHTCISIKLLDECQANMQVLGLEKVLEKIKNAVNYNLTLNFSDRNEIWQALALSPSVSSQLLPVLLSALQGSQICIKDSISPLPLESPLLLSRRESLTAFQSNIMTAKNSIDETFGKVEAFSIDEVLPASQDYDKARFKAPETLNVGDMPLFEPRRSSQNKDIEGRSSINEAFGAIGGEASPRRSLTIFQNKDVWGSDSFLSLFQKLISAPQANDNIRSGAVEALGWMGAVAALPELIIALKDKKIKVRKSAANALRRMGSIADQAVPELITALQDKDLDVRYSAAEALVSIKSTAESITIFLTALKDEESYVRDSAAHALGRIGPAAAAQAVPELLSALHDKEARVRYSAVYALGDIGHDSVKIVPGLLAALRDKDRGVKCAAALMLAMVRSADAEVISGLINALQDEDWQVWDHAGYALGMRGKTLSELLIIALQSKESRVRAGAACALGIMRPVVVQAIPELLAALQGNDTYVGSAAATVLRHMGSAAPQAVPKLLDIIQGQDIYSRSQAAMALSNMGSAAASAVPELLRALQYDDKYVRSRAALALSNMSTAASAIPISELVRVLQNNDSDVRQNVAKILGNMGPVAIPELIRVLQDNDSDVRQNAAEALKSISKEGWSEVIKLIAVVGNREIGILNDKLDCLQLLECFQLSNNPLWLDSFTDYSYLFKEPPLLCIIDGRLINLANGRELTNSQAQTKAILTILQQAIKETKLSTEVYDYYLGTDTLGLRTEQTKTLEYTPLHKASEVGELDKVKIIMDASQRGDSTAIDIDDQYNPGRHTALILAVKNRHWAVAKYLVEQKADVSCVDNESNTAVNLALQDEDPKMLKLLLQHCFISTSRLQKLLGKSVVSYTALAGDSGVSELTQAITGNRELENWQNNLNLTRNYRMYLDNIVNLNVEHQGLVKVDAAESSTILGIRLSIYAKLYLRLAKGLEVEPPLSSIEGQGCSIQQVLQILHQQIRTIADTIINDRLTLCFISSAYPQDLLQARADGIIARIQHMQPGQEYVIRSGYEGIPSGHCIYVSFGRLQENNVLARVDNRWLLAGRIDDKLHGREPWCMVQPDNPVKQIKSYGVGVFSLSKDKLALQSYIKGVMTAVSGGMNAESALEYVYGDKLPSNIKKNIAKVQTQMATWPYHNIQKNADNCTLSSHNMTVSVQCGNDLFKWLLQHELRAAPSLAGHSSKPSGAVPPKPAHTQAGGGGQSYSHQELMKRFQDCLGVSREEVYTGVAVEQALVAKAGIAAGQDDASFRQHSEGYTIFKLRFTSSSELKQFTEHYRMYPGLIVETPVYAANDMAAIIMDSTILYREVAPTLARGAERPQPVKSGDASHLFKVQDKENRDRCSLM